MKLLEKNEISANLAAAKVMRISAIVLTVVLILNIIGIFIIELNAMIIAYIVGEVFMLIPTLLVNLMKKSGKKYTKYVIVFCAVIFTAVLTAIMSKHTVLLYIYPVAIASLYFSVRLNVFSTVLSVIAVSVAQIVSIYIPGDVDQNYTDLKSMTIFGVLPRAMILFAVSMILIMLCKRAASMLGNLMSAEQQDLLREKSAEISQTLVSAVTEMDDISAKSAESSKSMSIESENVMRGSEENSESIRYVGENMNAISENLHNLDEMSNEIEQLLQYSDKITEENNSSLTVAEDGMKQIYTHTDNSMRIISELSKESKHISDIVKRIEDISMQTDILAINAAIEAAHAGEAGKGFSIVSEEIGTLSTQTKSFALEIKEIISEFMKNISEAVSTMEKNSKLTREGMENMNRIKESAEKLSSSNSDIFRNIEHIAEVISNVARSGNEVTDKLAGVSENIENNFIAMSSVSDIIRKNSEDMETLSTMVKNIREMSEQLDKLAK